MWQASDIYAEANPELLNEFSCSKIFGREAYFVRNTDGHSWHVDKVKHQMPERGLIVVRNLKFQNDEVEDEPIEDEIDDEIIWDNDFFTLNAPDIIKSSRIMEAGVFEFDDDPFPPSDFLQYLKSLHERTGAIIAYYFHFMWGGDTEIEYAWIFTDNEEVLVFKDYDNSYKFTEHNQIVIAESVLKRMLKFLGLEIPTGYFAPHTGTFDWERWRVKCNDEPNKSMDVRAKQLLSYRTGLCFP